MNTIPWITSIDAKSTDEGVKFLFKETENILDYMAPIKKVKKKNHKNLGKPWITQGILKSIRSKNKIHKSFLSEKNTNRKKELHEKFKTKRNILVRVIRVSQKLHYKSYFEENKTNIKKTWEGIKRVININKRNKVSPNRLDNGNGMITDKKDLANEFNKFFSTIGENINKKIPKSKKSFEYFLGAEKDTMFILDPVTENEVTVFIASLNESKAGSSSISTKFLKKFHLTFTPIITKLINKSFLDGAFPDSLKIADVVPIYKKDDMLKCCNYRPISLLSNISKIFE